MHARGVAAPPAEFVITSVSGTGAANDASVDTHVYALPENREPGDLILLLARFGASDQTEPTALPATGWSEFSCRMASGLSIAHYRVVGESEPGTVTITTNGTYRSAYTAHLIKGAATTDPVFIEGDGWQSAPTLTVPTWGEAETLWLTGLSHRQGPGSHSPPANYVDHVFYGVTAVTSNFAAHTAAAHRILTAETEQAGAWTLGGVYDSPHYFTAAIKPAAGAAPPPPPPEEIMFESVVKSTTEFVSTADVNIPAQMDGKLGVILIRSGRSPVHFDTPAGWTKVIETSSTARMALYVRACDGTEGATVPIVQTSDGTLSTTGRISAIAWRVGGVDVNAAQFVAAAQSSLSKDPPSLTIPWGVTADSEVLAVYSSRGSDWVVTAYPTDYPELDTVFNGSETDLGYTGIAIGHRAVNAASVDPDVFATTGTESAERTFTIALRSV